MTAALAALQALPAVSAVPVFAAVSGALPTRVSEYASSLRRKREETGVVLADIARVTGYDIADLLRMESGAMALEAAVYSRISAAISDLVLDKTRK